MSRGYKSRGLNYGSRTLLSFLIIVSLFLSSCDQSFNFASLLDGSAGALSIVPSTLTLNSAGTYTFTGSNGVPPYEFAIESIESGTPLIGSSSGLYGAGNTPGTDTIRITDSVGSIAEAIVTVFNLTSVVSYDTVVVSNTGAFLGGGALSGTFTFVNNGSDDGSSTVGWDVYISLDTVINTGDILVASSSTASLNSGNTSSPISFNGTWPILVSDTLYYLIVKITASDDFNTSDNFAYTSGTVTVP